MIERKLRIATKAGSMGAYVFHPDGTGPWSPIVLYMDAPGMREELRDMARRLATVGYHVTLPDLYYRVGDELGVDIRKHPLSDADRKSMFDLIRGLSNAKVVEDTEGIIAWLDTQPEARPGGIGVVGYCMSGPFAFAIAAAFPARIAAAASIYGAGLLTDRADSPHLAAAKIRGEIYFACAEIDEYFGLDKVKALEAHLAQTGIRYRVELYPKAEHGFAFPQRHCYDKASAERHWERLFDLYRRNL